MVGAVRSGRKRRRDRGELITLDLDPAIDWQMYRVMRAFHVPTPDDLNRWAFDDVMDAIEVLDAEEEAKHRATKGRDS
jgi:hypothetical protein